LWGIGAGGGRSLADRRGLPSANLAAVDFAIRRVGEDVGSEYGLLGSNSEVGGRRGQAPLHCWSAPKCNIFVRDAYASAGAAPRLADGGIPLARNWYDAQTPILAGNGGRFEVVATGDLRRIDLTRLKPGDVGIYAPIICTSGESSVPGYSNSQVVNLGGNSSLAAGERWIRPLTISAATPTRDNLLSPSPTQPLGGGVTWNEWGFRGDGQDHKVVVRRLIVP
jgi:hypothetical protein